MPQQERVNIAVFIDFDNIEIGVKNTLGEHFDIGTILEALKERGEVVTKIAYADWTRAGEYSRALTQHAIRLVQRNLTPGGDKNGADINLALDALEMVFTHSHINAYVIVGGDSDFLSLVEKLKQYDKKVFVVGGRAFTSIILQRNCHEFIAYENLVRKPVSKGGRQGAPSAVLPITQAFPIVRRALKILADREVSPQTGLLKSTLLQLDSTFSERNYGASSFLDFVERLAQAGLVQLKHAGRSVMVELNEGFDEADASTADLKARATTTQEARPKNGSAPQEARAPKAAASTEEAVTNVVQAFRPAQDRPPIAGDPVEGVRLAGEALRAAVNVRWPMYLRNIKQILRAAGFDERRYGFTGLMDLLRACQREGLVRVDRDRRGGLRISQGSTLAPAGAPRSETVQAAAPATEPLAVESVVPAEAPAPVEAEVLEVIEVEPTAVVDTTAELLGRAKSKRPRARSVAASGARRSAKKPAAGGPTRRTSRAHKTTGQARDDSGNV